MRTNGERENGTRGDECVAGTASLGRQGPPEKANRPQAQPKGHAGHQRLKAAVLFQQLQVDRARHNDLESRMAASTAKLAQRFVFHPEGGRMKTASTCLDKPAAWNWTVSSSSGSRLNSPQSFHVLEFQTWKLVCISGAGVCSFVLQKAIYEESVTEQSSPRWAHWARWTAVVGKPFSQLALQLLVTQRDFSPASSAASHCGSL
ncbi:hypothetical protein P4O66_010639 [Electrophorus voltai]|uniref:Uncharacterized protein n=1 Tax=Electrophorus voltai TaxID=2609070 RepID=A0AAD8ZAL7_9TELE|nr:hypothetical protein P4O66_010639 [Electrophorus voltai]